LNGAQRGRLLRLLTAVMSDRNKAFDGFIPDVIALCASQLGQLVRSTEVRPTLP